MSTIYDFDEKDPLSSIEAHYFNNGWDVTGFAFGDETNEIGDTYIEMVDGDFVDDLVEIVEDVFCGDTNTYIVTCFEAKFGGNVMNVYKMTTSDFKTNWSEKVWAKFRMDSYTHVCPECGQKMAHSVSGSSAFGERIEQFHCDGCHYTWVGFPNGKFIREGILLSSWEIGDRNWR